ncbi:MAG: glycerate kinase [Candidatus Brocadiales bacterium]
MRTTSEPRKCAKDIFNHALKAVDPFKLIKEKIKLEGQTLKVAERRYNLRETRHVFLIAVGKASALMAKALEGILGDRLSGGIVIVKYGHGLSLKRSKVIEAAHPVPDKKGLEAASYVFKLASGAGKRDLVFCLLSGGGSALLCRPPEGIMLGDIRSLTKQLLASGADIKEINIVRKHLSLVHGGRLAKAIYPAFTVNLILSDVVGNQLNMVASGPTLPDESTFEDAINILNKYKLTNKVPRSILRYLKMGMMGKVSEGPRKSNPCFKHCQTVLLGSNALALEAAERRARALGFNGIILSSSITGEAREVARVLVSMAKEVLENGRPVPRPACLLAGGETTVTLKGRGMGGRNQEFALAAALELEGCSNIVVLSGGTDGTDGPTDVAGAVIDTNTYRRAKKGLRLDAADYLHRNDSYRFFQRAGGHIVTGPTQTNVMDIMMALVG